MTVHPSRLPLPTPPASGPRAPGPVADVAAAALTEAEQAQIAASFPARPQVAHRLYGPGRSVQAPPQVGGRLDLSA